MPFIKNNILPLHTPACKAKAKDRNINCKQNFKYSVIFRLSFLKLYQSQECIACTCLMYTQDDYIFGYRNSLFFNRRRSYEMKNIRPQKDTLHQREPGFSASYLPEKSLNFRDVSRTNVAQRWPLSRDTEYFQKN